MSARWGTAHNGDVLCRGCGGVGAASCVCDLPQAPLPVTGDTVEFGRVYGTTEGDVAVRAVAFVERWEADQVEVVDEIRGTDHYDHPTRGREVTDRNWVRVEFPGDDDKWHDEVLVTNLVPIADDAWCRTCATVHCDEEGH